MDLEELESPQSLDPDINVDLLEEIKRMETDELWNDQDDQKQREQ